MERSNSIYQVSIEGTISWDLICNYDNIYNNGGIRNECSITSTASINHDIFKRGFNEAVRKELNGRHEENASYEILSLVKLDRCLHLSTEISEALQRTALDLKWNYTQVANSKSQSTYQPHALRLKRIKLHSHHSNSQYRK